MLLLVVALVGCCALLLCTSVASMKCQCFSGVFLSRVYIFCLCFYCAWSRYDVAGYCWVIVGVVVEC